MNEDKELRNNVERTIQRMKRAEEQQSSFFSLTVYLGTLGMLIVIPIVFAAFAGAWLDRQFGTYFLTFGLVAAGAVVGMINVWLYVRK